MSLLSTLSGDSVFWLSLVAFGFSILGVLWILRALQASSHDDGTIYSSPDEPEIMERTGPFNAPDASNLGPEDLGQRIAHMERMINDMAQKLEKQSQTQLSPEEIKNIMQILKAQPQGTGVGGEEMRALSSKVDKIYQILGALSETEDKP